MAAAAQASTSKHVLVVGGAGFLGSAITKRLVSRGHTVTSISRSGHPFLTPSGHRPAWSSSPRLKWRAGDAHNPQTYRSILEGNDEEKLPPVSAVVSTMGILLEGDYKGSSSSMEGTARALLKGWGIGGDNPLREDEGHDKAGPSYERMNRDAALAVASTWRDVLSSTTSASTSLPPFLFISAEDIFRPIIDARYILTKRQAEQGLRELSWVTTQRARTSSFDADADADGAGLDGEMRQARRQVFRSIALRPGLMYHPHTRPLSTLPAALLDLSCNIHSSRLASLLPATPASVLAGVLGQQPLARLLTISPLHIDTVAKAAAEAIARDGFEGVVDTKGIMDLAGFKQAGGGGEQQGTTSTWAERA